MPSLELAKLNWKMMRRKEPRLLGPGCRPKHLWADLQGHDMWFENYQRARAFFLMNDAILAGPQETPQAKAYYRDLKEQSKQQILTKEFMEEIPYTSWQDAFEYNVKLYRKFIDDSEITRKRVAKVHKKLLAGDPEMLKKYPGVDAY